MPTLIITFWKLKAEKCDKKFSFALCSWCILNNLNKKHKIMAIFKNNSTADDKVLIDLFGVSEYSLLNLVKTSLVNWN